MRSPGHPRPTWTKTIQQDLSLNEAIDVTHNRQLWRLMSTFAVCCHALLVVLVIKEEEEEVLGLCPSVCRL